MKRKKKRAYGSGGIVGPSKNGTYAVRYRLNGKRYQKSGLESLDIARRVLEVHRGDLAAGRSGLPADPNRAQTLGELACPFLEVRKHTHRAGEQDASRWRKHLAPYFAHLKPGEVSKAHVRQFVNAKVLGEINDDGDVVGRLSGGSIRICIALLSSLFVQLIEDKVAVTNPARDLSRDVLRLATSTYDPKTTPFIERLEDIRRIFLSLEEPINVAYAIGALGGLRTGEVVALKWAQVNLNARRIHVVESVKGRLKDDETRIVPIMHSLHPILTAWKVKTGGEGLVIKPMRKDGAKIWPRTLNKKLLPTLEALGLKRPNLGWYEATRHTFASQWVLNGGSIEKLKEILGHYSVVMTERYAHLRPDLFSEKDFGTVSVDLSSARGEVLEIGRKLGGKSKT